MNQRLRIPDWLLLLVFCAFFFFWRLAAFGLIGADEPRYAQVAREMFEANDWVTPRLGGNPWLEKPPLYYWQAMVFYRLMGVSDSSARLPSVVQATLLVLAVYWFLRRFRPGFALAGALLMAASAGIVGYARAASMDILLAADFALAILAWYAWFETRKRVFLIGSYLLLALGMLAKGPVAPLLAVAIIVIFASVERNLAIARQSVSIPGILTFCAVSLPWYVLVQIRNPQFFRVFLVEHNLARFGTNMFHHLEPFWYYLPVMILAWVPYSAFAVAALVAALKRLRDRDRDPLGRLLVIWLVVVVLFFSMSKSKLPGYILPALPAGVLLLGNFIEGKLGEPVDRFLVALHAVLTGALTYGALALPYIVVEHRLPQGAAAVSPLLGGIVLGVATAVLFLKMGWDGLRLATVVPAILALAIVLRLGSPALDETFSARPISEALSSVSRRRLPVAVLLVPREIEFGLEFYRNQSLPRYELGQVPPGAHLVVARQGSKSALLEGAAGRRVTYLGSFPPQKIEFFYVSDIAR